MSVLIYLMHFRGKIDGLETHPASIPKAGTGGGTKGVLFLKGLSWVF